MCKDIHMGNMASRKGCNKNDRVVLNRNDVRLLLDLDDVYVAAHVHVEHSCLSLMEESNCKVGHV